MAGALTRPSLEMNLLVHSIHYGKGFEIFQALPRLLCSIMFRVAWYRLQLDLGSAMEENTEENSNTDYDGEDGNSSKQCPMWKM